MSFVARRLAAFSAAVIMLAASGGSAFSQKKYDVGATDSEIKIGNIMPYSGPASAYGIIGRTEAAYFRKINAEGGINGRKVNFISYDDAYSPRKRLSRRQWCTTRCSWSSARSARRLIRPFKGKNTKKVPQLFVATVIRPNEARIYAKYILKEN
jgi:branched-chain amino acid transport system substrate-binding protein